MSLTLGHFLNLVVGAVLLGLSSGATFQLTNRDYVGCVSVDVKGYGCNYHFERTTEIHAGKEVYRNANRNTVIWWGNNGRWYCGPSIGTYYEYCESNDFAKCSSRLVTSNCLMFYRKDGRCNGYKSDGNSLQRGLCTPQETSSCCSSASWCGNTGAHCECRTCIDYKKVTGPCVLEQVTQPVDLCAITPLDKVDHEIAKQMLWNVAGVLAGAIPVGKHVFDLYFAIMAPLGPTSSPYSLVDYVIEGVNTQVTRLQECMEQEITNVKVDLIQTHFHEVIRESQLCAELTGTEKISCVQQLFQTFHGRLATFATQASNYLEYENLLPIYQSMYPLWMTVTAGRLADLKDANDGCNFNTILQFGKDGMDVFLNWAQTWALESIVAEYTPDTSWDNGQCNYETEMDKYHTIYTSNKNLLYGREYFSRGKDCQDYPQYRVFDIWVQTRTKGSHSQQYCKMTVEGTWMCGMTYPQMCDTLLMNARPFTNDIKNRLRDEYRPEFLKKFVENVRKYRDDMNNIPEMTCASAVAVEKTGMNLYHVGSEQGGGASSTTREQARNTQIGIEIGLVGGLLCVVVLALGMCAMCFIKRRWGYHTLDGPSAHA